MTSDQITKVRLALQRRYWIRTLYEGVAPGAARKCVPEYDIPLPEAADGRKRPAMLRELAGAGLIDILVVSGESHYSIARVVGQIVEATRPDLAAMAGIATASAHRLNHSDDGRGMMIDKLDAGALRFVAENLDAYTPLDRWGRPVTWHGRRTEIAAITDEGMRTAVAARLLDLEVADATKRNLAWGLRTAHLIDEEDAKLIKAQDPLIGLAFNHDAASFGDDPAQWGAMAIKTMDNLRERIAQDTRMLLAVERAHAAVTATGGWDKFVAEYKPRIDAAYRAEKATKAEHAARPTDPAPEDEHSHRPDAAEQAAAHATTSDS